MKQLLRWCGLILAFFPLLASADPIVFNTVANGTIRPDAPWLSTFTGLPQAAPGDPIPFEFRLNGSIDTSRSGAFQEGNFAFQQGQPSNMTLTVGGHTYEIANTGTFQVIHLPDTYSVHLMFYQGSTWFTTSIYFQSNARPFEGGPLSLREIETHGAATTASYWFRAFPSETQIIEVSGRLDSASLSVTSTIPEPGQASLLLSGLLLMIAMRWRALRHAILKR